MLDTIDALTHTSPVGYPRQTDTGMAGHAPAQSPSQCAAGTTTYGKHLCVVTPLTHCAAPVNCGDPGYIAR
jgi:hypothetical protein